MSRFTTAARTLGLAALIAASFSAHAADPVLWIDDGAGVLGKVDITTGAVTVVGNMRTTMTDIAFDPHGNLYGVDFGTLYRINTTNAATTAVGGTGTSVNSLVFGSNGTLYAANSSLYTLNLATGAGTSLGHGGVSYSSSGDLAFLNGNLFLSSASSFSDELVKLDAATGFATDVGAIGTGAVYGLATDNATLYGVAGTKIYTINPSTGAGTLLLDYAGHGLGGAYGTSFFQEAVAAPIPEPENAALLLAGLALVGVAVRRHRKA